MHRTDLRPGHRGAGRPPGLPASPTNSASRAPRWPPSSIASRHSGWSGASPWRSTGAEWGTSQPPPLPPRRCELGHVVVTIAERVGGYRAANQAVVSRFLSDVLAIAEAAGEA